MHCEHCGWHGESRWSHPISPRCSPEVTIMRISIVVLVALLALYSCSPNTVSLSSLVGTERVEVRYMLPDGTWVPADSLRWTQRTWYRQLRFDTDGDGVWNYLYCEVFDDVAGWVWIPSTTRVNPEEEPELARQKKYLVSPEEKPPKRPGVDDFGYPIKSIQ